MRKINISKRDLFEKYIVENKSYEQCATELGVNTRTIKRRINEWNWLGVKKNVNKQWGYLSGYFWKEYIPDSYKKSFEEKQQYKIDYYRKTLVENLLYDKSTKTFRPKTPEEKQQEVEDLERERSEVMLAKWQCNILKNKESYPKTYKKLVEISEKLNLRNSFDEACIKECEEFSQQNLQEEMF